MYRASASVFRFHTTTTDLSVHLHEGYDWVKTRKLLEEQAKLIRKRLSKIRDLLASGQTGAGVADEHRSLLSDSEQLGLPPGAENMDAKQLLALIEEELRDDVTDMTETSSIASSEWQSFPTVAMDSSSRKATSTKTSTRRKGPKRRSRSAAIEFNLLDISLKYDTFPQKADRSNRLSVDVNSFNIIDNIKTSTWYKFLTELRTTDGGIVRATGLPMIRLEIVSVHVPKSTDEIIMRVSDISLHVKSP
jgi:autophagy-related protein 2